MRVCRASCVHVWVCVVYVSVVLFCTVLCCAVLRRTVLCRGAMRCAARCGPRPRSWTSPKAIALLGSPRGNRSHKNILLMVMAFGRAPRPLPKINGKPETTIPFEANVTKSEFPVWPWPVALRTT